MKIIYSCVLCVVCCVNAFGQKDTIAGNFLKNNKHIMLNKDIYIIQGGTELLFNRNSFVFTLYLLSNKNVAISNFYYRNKKVGIDDGGNGKIKYGNYEYWGGGFYNLYKTHNSLADEPFFIKYTKNKKTYWVRVPLNLLPAKQFQLLYPTDSVD